MEALHWNQRAAWGSGTGIATHQGFGVALSQALSQWRTPLAHFVFPPGFAHRPCGVSGDFNANGLVPGGFLKLKNNE
jgi:hypothetical protein